MAGLAIFRLHILLFAAVIFIECEAVKDSTLNNFIFTDDENGNFVSAIPEISQYERKYTQDYIENNVDKLRDGVQDNAKGVFNYEKSCPSLRSNQTSNQNDLQKENQFQAVSENIFGGNNRSKEYQVINMASDNMQSHNQSHSEWALNYSPTENSFQSVERANQHQNVDEIDSSQLRIHGKQKTKMRLGFNVGLGGGNFGFGFGAGINDGDELDSHKANQHGSGNAGLAINAGINGRDKFDLNSGLIIDPLGGGNINLGLNVGPNIGMGIDAGIDFGDDVNSKKATTKNKKGFGSEDEPNDGTHIGAGIDAGIDFGGDVNSNEAKNKNKQGFGSAEKPYDDAHIGAGFDAGIQFGDDVNSNEPKNKDEQDFDAGVEPYDSTNIGVGFDAGIHFGDDVKPNEAKQKDEQVLDAGVEPYDGANIGVGIDAGIHFGDDVNSNETKKEDDQVFDTEAEPYDSANIGAGIDAGIHFGDDVNTNNAKNKNNQGFGSGVEPYDDANIETGINYGDDVDSNKAKKEKKQGFGVGPEPNVGANIGVDFDAGTNYSDDFGSNKTKKKIKNVTAFGLSKQENDNEVGIDVEPYDGNNTGEKSESKELDSNEANKENETGTGLGKAPFDDNNVEPGIDYSKSFENEVDSNKTQKKNQLGLGLPYGNENHGLDDIFASDEDLWNDSNKNKDKIEPEFSDEVYDDENTDFGDNAGIAINPYDDENIAPDVDDFINYGDEVDSNSKLPGLDIALYDDGFPGLGDENGENTAESGEDPSIEGNIRPHVDAYPYGIGNVGSNFDPKKPEIKKKNRPNLGPDSNAEVNIKQDTYRDEIDSKKLKKKKNKRPALDADLYPEGNITLAVNEGSIENDEIHPIKLNKKKKKRPAEGALPDTIGGMNNGDVIDSNKLKKKKKKPPVKSVDNPYAEGHIIRPDINDGGNNEDIAKPTKEKNKKRPSLDTDQFAEVNIAPNFNDNIINLEIVNPIRPRKKKKKRPVLGADPYTEGNLSPDIEDDLHNGDLMDPKSLEKKKKDQPNLEIDPFPKGNVSPNVGDGMNNEKMANPIKPKKKKKKRPILDADPFAEINVTPDFTDAKNDENMEDYIKPKKKKENRPALSADPNAEEKLEPDSSDDSNNGDLIDSNKLKKKKKERPVIETDPFPGMMTPDVDDGTNNKEIFASMKPKTKKKKRPILDADPFAEIKVSPDFTDGMNNGSIVDPIKPIKKKKKRPVLSADPNAKEIIEPDNNNDLNNGDFIDANKLKKEKTSDFDTNLYPEGKLTPNVDDDINDGNMVNPIKPKKKKKKRPFLDADPFAEIKITPDFTDGINNGSKVDSIKPKKKKKKRPAFGADPNTKINIEPDNNDALNNGDLIDTNKLKKKKKERPLFQTDLLSEGNIAPVVDDGLNNEEMVNPIKPKKKKKKRPILDADPFAEIKVTPDITNGINNEKIGDPIEPTTKKKKLPVLGADTDGNDGINYQDEIDSNKKILPVLNFEPHLKGNIGLNKNNGSNIEDILDSSEIYAGSVVDPCVDRNTQTGYYFNAGNKMDSNKAKKKGIIETKLGFCDSENIVSSTSGNKFASHKLKNIKNTGSKTEHVLNSKIADINRVIGTYPKNTGSNCNPLTGMNTKISTGLKIDSTKPKNRKKKETCITCCCFKTSSFKQIKQRYDDNWLGPKIQFENMVPAIKKKHPILSTDICIDENIEPNVDGGLNDEDRIYSHNSKKQPGLSTDPCTVEIIEPKLHNSINDKDMIGSNKLTEKHKKQGTLSADPYVDDNIGPNVKDSINKEYMIDSNKLKKNKHPFITIDPYVEGNIGPEEKVSINKGYMVDTNKLIKKKQPVISDPYVKGNIRPDVDVEINIDDMVDSNKQKKKTNQITSYVPESKNKFKPLARPGKIKSSVDWNKINNKPKLVIEPLDKERPELGPDKILKKYKDRNKNTVLSAGLSTDHIGIKCDGFKTGISDKVHINTNKASEINKKQTRLYSDRHSEALGNAGAICCSHVGIGAGMSAGMEVDSATCGQELSTGLPTSSRLCTGNRNTELKSGPFVGVNSGKIAGLKANSESYRGKNTKLCTNLINYLNRCLGKGQWSNGPYSNSNSHLNIGFNGGVGIESKSKTKINVGLEKSGLNKLSEKNDNSGLNVNLMENKSNGRFHTKLLTGSHIGVNIPGLSGGIKKDFNKALFRSGLNPRLNANLDSGLNIELGKTGLNSDSRIAMNSDSDSYNFKNIGISDGLNKVSSPDMKANRNKVLAPGYTIGLCNHFALCDRNTDTILNEKKTSECSSGFCVGINDLKSAEINSYPKECVNFNKCLTTELGKNGLHSVLHPGISTVTNGNSKTCSDGNTKLITGMKTHFNEKISFGLSLEKSTDLSIGTNFGLTGGLNNNKTTVINMDSNKVVKKKQNKARLKPGSGLKTSAEVKPDSKKVFKKNSDSQFGVIAGKDARENVNLEPCSEKHSGCLNTGISTDVKANSNEGLNGGSLNSDLPCHNGNTDVGAYLNTQIIDIFYKKCCTGLENTVNVDSEPCADGYTGSSPNSNIDKINSDIKTGTNVGSELCEDQNTGMNTPLECAINIGLDHECNEGIITEIGTSASAYYDSCEKISTGIEHSELKSHKLSSGANVGLETENIDKNLDLGAVTKINDLNKKHRKKKYPFVFGNQQQDDRNVEINIGVQSNLNSNQRTDSHNRGKHIMRMGQNGGGLERISSNFYPYSYDVHNSGIQSGYNIQFSPYSYIGRQGLNTAPENTKVLPNFFKTSLNTVRRKQAISKGQNIGMSSRRHTQFIPHSYVRNRFRLNLNAEESLI